MMAELVAPYGELRLDGEPYNEEQVFYMLHGESKESLKVGRLGVWQVHKANILQCIYATW
jgi:hypothetical protein